MLASLGPKADRGEHQAVADFNAELRYRGPIALQPPWKLPRFCKPNVFLLKWDFQLNDRPATDFALDRD